jgi:hypothetical protein
LKLSKNPEFHAKIEHIDLPQHYIRGQINKATAALEHVDTKDNIATVLTKALFRLRHSELVEMMGLREPPEELLCGKYTSPT